MIIVVRLDGGLRIVFVVAEASRVVERWYMGHQPDQIIAEWVENGDLEGDELRLEQPENAWLPEHVVILRLLAAYKWPNPTELIRWALRRTRLDPNPPAAASA